MEPFQSGGLGKGGKGRGIILVSEVGDYAHTPIKVVVICIYFKQVMHGNGIEGHLQTITEMSSSWSL